MRCPNVSFKRWRSCFFSLLTIYSDGVGFRRIVSAGVTEDKGFSGVVQITRRGQPSSFLVSNKSKCVFSRSRLRMRWESQEIADEAGRLNERSLGILENSCGPEHPDVGEALSRKALLLDAQVSVGDSIEMAWISPRLLFTLCGRTTQSTLEGIVLPRVIFYLECTAERTHRFRMH